MLESVQRRLLVLLDIKQLVQLGDLEDLKNLRVDATEPQAASSGRNRLVHRDQLPQGRARQVHDVSEVQQDLARTVDQAEHLLPHLLDVGFVQDLLVREVDDGHSLEVLFHHQATPPTTDLRHVSPLMISKTGRVAGAVVKELLGESSGIPNPDAPPPPPADP